MKLRILLGIGLLAGQLAGCSNHTLYLVRHAEKASQPASDPPLTAEGEVRAQVLADTLLEKNIKHIYSTNTTRTRATAVPLAEKLGLTIAPYGTDTLWEVAKHLRKLHGGNALIVGHSNTLLPLLDQLPVTHRKKTIPDSDYDNLFVVTVRKRFLRPPLIRLQEGTFGEIAE
ncbi:phosphoglycerate mutase family protein [Persicitalea sp.]|uniref:phosphoglycerate mutase family protein n=1 Tax=Persicitalea sp. TaxID=3100273 RepID=UPI0035946C59